MMHPVLKLRADAFEQSAERHRQHNPTGHVVFSECTVCGLVEWKATHTRGLVGAEPGGYTVEPVETQDCKRCNTAYIRGPEITEWMLGVIAHQQRTLITAIRDGSIHDL